MVHNCIPLADDAVIISAGHVIMVTQDIECASMYVDTGAQLISHENIHVHTGCP